MSNNSHNEHSYTELQKEALELANRVRTTAGARFEAARRHSKKLRTSNISIVILSSYAILFSMAAAFIEFKDDYIIQTLNMLSIFMSALIISFSLFEGTKRHDLKAEMFLKCSQNLHELMNDIYLYAKNTQISLNKIAGYQKDYNKIISNYSNNHADLDLYRFWSKTNSKKFKNKPVLKIIIKIKYYLNIWFLPILAALSPLLLILMMVGSRLVIGIYFNLFEHQNLFSEWLFRNI